MSKRKKFTVHILRDKLGLKPSQELLDHLKEQKRVEGLIRKAILKDPKTVPEIAEETGLDETLVFWYLMTFFRHGLIEETGKTDEGYFKYVWKERR
ncbi:MAG: hypothetical protein F7B59_02840 [Desulfurococcales archaeon]|nr:hypothetical protein [Desulfurococcales archaeon]